MPGIKGQCSCCLQRFDIATRKGDEATQLSILEQCKAANEFTAEDFLKLGRLCRGHQFNTLSAAKEAFKAGLQALLAQQSSASPARLAQVKISACLSWSTDMCSVQHFRMCSVRCCLRTSVIGLISSMSWTWFTVLVCMLLT